MGTEVVDVVIPTVGRWELLGQAVDSVETQDNASTRVIVVNDSGGPTPAWLEDRTRVVTTPGRVGEGAARAFGMNEVRSRLVAFCDDDDRWEPTKLARQISAIGADEGWCLTGARRVAEDDRPVGEWALTRLVEWQERGLLDRRLLVHNPVPAGPSSVLMSAALLERVGGWNDRLRYFADWDLWIRLSSVCAPILLDEPLVLYRHWPGQMIGDRRDGWEALDLIRVDHAARRRAFGVGPLDDRVILWILQGELQHRGRRVAGMTAAARRLRPTHLSDLGALGRHANELLGTVRRRAR